MAHKKGQGSVKNGRDSNAKRRGLKLFGGQHAYPGSVLCRQCGTKWRPGKNVYQGKDFTLHSLIEGVVRFSNQGRVINVDPPGVQAPADTADDDTSPAVAVKPLSPTRRRSEPRQTPHRENPTHQPPLQQVEKAIVGSFFKLLKTARKGDAAVAETHHDLLINPDPRLRLTEPGLGVRVGGEVLHVPPILYTFLVAHSVATAAGLVSYLRAFPSAVAAGLGLEFDLVKAEVPRLIGTLKGHVDDAFLTEPSPSRLKYGANLEDE
jgi:large subunit ribosomal protein L27